MTSYGGYTRTGYGAQGGEDGGGFMSGSQQASQSEKKSFADDTLRPVTVKQLIDSKEAYPGAELAVDGVPTTQVTLVGQVRAVNPQAINVTYRVDDGTGVIDVKKWHDADKEDTTPRFALDTYVRVYGRLQSYNNKRLVTAHHIRVIEDFNEVNYHLLEATYVHLTLTLTRGGQPQQHPQQDGGGDGGDSMFVDGYGGGGTSGEVQAKLSSCSRSAHAIYSFMANTPGDSVHLTQVTRGTGLAARDVMAAAQELLDQGIIYTTDDDETWAMMDS